MAADDFDADLRVQAFRFLDDLRAARGDALPRELLIAGFTFRGKRVALMSPQQGIFKPAQLEIPLSIMTAPEKKGRPRPYEDSVGANGVIHYKYRGTDPSHRDNVGLREAMRRQSPLIYFVGLIPGSYYAEYPAFIVGDRPEALEFSVQVDD